MGMVGCFCTASSSDLIGLRDGSVAVEDYLYPDGGEGQPPYYVDVDKAWHGLHYLLTGQADGGRPPQSWVILGGQEFGSDVGFGPARFLTPDQVRTVAELLSKTDAERLASRFDPADMARKNIYPEVIWERDGHDALEYVLENYTHLQTFYQDASDRGDCVLQWIA